MISLSAITRFAVVAGAAAAVVDAVYCPTHTASSSANAPSQTTYSPSATTTPAGGYGGDHSSSASSAASSSSSSAPAPLPTDYSLDFLIIGDWGQDKNAADQVGVAKQMNKWAADNKSSLIISLGDNFYSGGRYAYEGVNSTTDVKFKTMWQDVYQTQELSALAPLPWWQLLGNHDWYLNESNYYEMVYGLNNNKWYQPDYFYTERVKLHDADNKKYHATFIFIETDLLNYGVTGKAKTDMAANFKKAKWDDSTAAKQIAWLDQALAKANKDPYVFVLGHHPVFACGDDVKKSANMSDVLTIINKWKPTAFLNGHHHTLAYYYTNNNQTLQIQIGNGGNADAACAPLDLAAPGTETANVYGFGHALITPQNFTVDFITESGQVNFTASIPPRKPVDAVAAEGPVISDLDPAVSFKWRLD